MKVLGREPALIISVISAGLSIAVTYGTGLSGEQAGAIVAVITAIAGAVTAASVRPIAPAAFKLVVTSGAALLAAFGLHLSPEQVGAVTAAVIAVLTLLTRAQVTPAADQRGTDVPTTADPITADGVRGLVR